MKPSKALPVLIFGMATSTQVLSQHNVLTASEASAGYTLLYNGQSGPITGWRSWNSATPPSSWASLPESTWYVLQNSSSPTSSLITNDLAYRNFDLKVEWNVPSQGNSGIFIRYAGYPGGILGAAGDGWGGATGPESQIAATNNTDGSGPLTRAGACYSMFPLRAQATNWDVPGGGTNYNRYQQFRIVAYENHVAHFGNGIKLVEYVIRSPAWNTAYSASKYNTYPMYGDIHAGGIYLQHHGEPNIKFRDLRAKKLSQNPWALGSPYLINPSDTTSGLRDLTFADNLFPPVFVFSPIQSNQGLQLFPTADGLFIRFQKRGDYIVRVQDFRGRSRSNSSVSDAGSFLIPAGSLQGGNILTIWNADKKIHQSILARP